MKTKLLPLLTVLVFSQVAAQTGPPSEVPLNAARAQIVERLAAVYRIPRAEALNNYEAILGSDVKKAGVAAGALKRQNAFELLVAALADAKDPDVRKFLLEEILYKRDFSPSACAALLDELDARNQSLPDNGELRAGYELKKGQIATLVSRWLGIPDPKIPFDPFESRAAYSEFSATARAKAATMTTNSPY
jgi:hypothetical protein